MANKETQTYGFYGACELEVSLDSNLVIDVQSNSQGTLNGEPLYLQNRQKAKNSKWIIKPYTGNLNIGRSELYVIYNENDDTQAITFNDYDEPLTLEPFNEEYGQLWMVFNTGSGWNFRSYNDASFVISTKEKKIEIGTAIVIENDNYHGTQLWNPQYNRYPAEDLQEGKYAILTKMNELFCMYNENGPGPIKMNYAINFPDPYSHVIFDVVWWEEVQAYTLRLDHTTLVLSIEDGSIVTKPFDKENPLQYWSIQKAENNMYTIESISRPLQYMDIKGASTAPLPGGSVIVYNKNGNVNQQWIFENPINFGYDFYQWEGPNIDKIGGVYFKIKNPDLLKYIERYKIEIEGFGVEYPWGKPIKHEVLPNQVIKVSTGGAYGVDKQTKIKVWAIDNQGEYILILDRLVNSNDTVSQTRGLPTSSFQTNMGNKNDVKMQFNFYDSTCNTFINDDHRIE